MKLVVQRVNEASVSANDKTVGRISKGLFVLVGIKKSDTLKNAEELSKRLVKLRVMADKNGKMNLSNSGSVGAFLIVSQFTLYANTRGGNRPSFINASEPSKAERIYNYFVKNLKELGANVETGEFGNYMNIKANLDGPVTIIMEND